MKAVESSKYNHRGLNTIANLFAFFGAVFILYNVAQLIKTIF